jgi:hypothetical protein
VDDRSRRQAILASDAEREEVTFVLREAVGGGRLTLEEFSERVDIVQSARTDRELAAVTADLPGRRQVDLGPAPIKHTAFCSQLVRRGPWELPARSHWRSLFGTIVLDLRQAVLTGPEIELTVFNLFGTVIVIVPPRVAVTVEGGGAFASQVIDPCGRVLPARGPRLTIRTSGPGGTLHVRSSPFRRRLARVLDKLLES